MTFDVPTIMMTSAMIFTLVAAIQFLIAQRLHIKALVYWSASNFALSAAAAIMSLRAVLPLQVAVLGGNGFLFLGLGAVLLGVQRFNGRRPQTRLVTFTCLAGIALLAFSLTQGDRLGDRISIVSLLIAAWAIAAVYTLLRHSHHIPMLSRGVCAAFLIGLAVIYVLRGISVHFGAVSAEEALLGRQQAIVLLSSLALTIGWSFGSLFLVLDRLASIDDLTGLFNRRTTLLQGRALLNIAQAKNRLLSVLMVDLDHFKSVNDNFGHQVGDEVLRQFAEVARRTVRSSDVIGRIGGEEFCVILPGADDVSAREVAERLRAAAARELQDVQGCPTQVTITIGVATVNPTPISLNNISSLINAADSALYEAKARGRNRVLTAISGFEPRWARLIPDHLSPPLVPMA